MVFEKNVEKNQIEEFEDSVLKKISNFPLVVSLKNDLTKKGLNCKIQIQRTETDLKKYLSHLVIDVFDEKGERLCEHDEPYCCLMLCETICFVHKGGIMGIDLSTNKEFIESLQLLISKTRA